MVEAVEVMNAESGSLARKVGLLIRQERQKQDLSQIRLARRAGIDQAALSRLELGRHGTSTMLIERVLEALGFELAIDVEPLDRALDETIAAYSNVDDDRREAVAGRFHFPMARLADSRLDYRLAGTFGAFLLGVPIDAVALDLAITADGSAMFAAWLARIPSALRWDDTHRDFIGYNRDPLTGGAARWGTPGGEIRAVVLDELPAAVTVRVANTDYQVLPLSIIASWDPQVARVVNRLSARGEG